MLQEGVCHGSMQLLGLDESSPCIVVLRHDCLIPVSGREESGARFGNHPHQFTHQAETPRQSRDEYGDNKKAATGSNYLYVPI